jgi:hypothetical protein
MAMFDRLSPEVKTLKQVKRKLALLKAEVELGRAYPFDLPEGFKESFECQEKFRGWINYHVTWDVADSDPWTVVTLKESREATWNQQLAERVPYITQAGEVVTPKQFERLEASGAKTLADLDDLDEAGVKTMTELAEFLEASEG